MPKFMDLTGQQFGKLTVVKQASKLKKRVRWWCECSCGNRKIVLAGNLRNGATTSCGCHRSLVTAAATTTHGLSDVPEYSVWRGMRRRCQNPTYHQFELYGGRGITICERWRTFENFYADMGPRPTPHHSIDRIDPDGDYEPKNCRWVDAKTQNSNRRHCYQIRHNGEVMTLKELSRRTGRNAEAMARRIRALGLPRKGLDSTQFLC